MGGKLVDLQTAKDFVGISSTSQDTLIDTLLFYISNSIIRLLGVKDFDYGATKDIFYPTYGENRKIFKLSKYPVDLNQPFTVKTVSYDENIITTIDDKKYYVIAERGTLVFSNPDDIFTSKMIEVEYTAGYQKDANNVYQNIPDGLRFACLLWFSTIWNTRELRGIERVSNDVRKTIQIATQNIPEDVKQIIFQYQRNSF